MNAYCKWIVFCLASTLFACGPGDVSKGEEPLIIPENNGSGADMGVEQEPDQEADAGSESDGGGEATQGLSLLGNGTHSMDSVEWTVIANADDQLASPRDLEFNPDVPTDLWIVNKADSSTVIVSNPGTANVEARRFAGPGNTHFMAKPSSLAFGISGTMATAQQEDQVTQPTTPGDFMGPTLWSTDLDIFDAGHHGHLDMLHNSPLGSGIAWDEGTAYWLFDGYHRSITHYDFQGDHGPGGADHSDGIVRRFVEGEVEMVADVVSHLAFNHETGLLYVADSGNNRIAVLDVNTGEAGAEIFPNYDGTTQNYVMGASLETLVEGSEAGLERPAGLELHDDLLFVGDNLTSTIWAFDLDGNVVDHLDLSEAIPAESMMGLAFDSEGLLYVADADNNQVLRISPASE